MRPDEGGDAKGQDPDFFHHIPSLCFGAGGRNASNWRDKARRIHLLFAPISCVRFDAGAEYCCRMGEILIVLALMVAAPLQAETHAVETVKMILVFVFY